MIGRGLRRAIQRADPAPFMGGGAGRPGHLGLGDNWSDQTSYWIDDPVRQLAGPYSYPNPVTNPGGYSHHLNDNGGERTVLGLAAAWRCLHILTDGIGALEMQAISRDYYRQKIETPKVLSDPWPVMSPVEWRASVVASLVLYGNAYLLPYDPDPRTGYPRQLPILHPHRVHMRMTDGQPRYYYRDWDVELDAIDVLHIRGYLPPGENVGIGVIEALRRTIGNATSLDVYQSTNIVNSSVPPAIIKINRPEISEEQAEEIQRRWVQRHGGPNRRPAVIPTSMDVETIAWSPQDTQFLESKQFSAVELCWMFGVDPRLLGLAASGQSMTYVNVETAYVDLQRMSFQPWTSRIEAALSRVLPRGANARFDFAPMIRTTLSERYSAYETGIGGGWLTIDEVRALEGMGPLDEPPKDAVGLIEPIKAVNESLPSQSEGRNTAGLHQVVA